MEPLALFLAYAQDFEKTVVDDDWQRLEGYFDEDATYHVDSELFGCQLAGRSAVFAGLKKSLDGFDRRFDKRRIEVVDGPEVDGDTVRIGWQVTYEKEGLEPFLLRGRSTVTCRDGRIVAMVDGYDAQASADAAAWQRGNPLEIDPSYT